MKLLKIMTLLFCVYSCDCAVGGTESLNKPNIIFFFVDDMGWQETSEPFHSEITELNKRFNTPNMVRLADQGVKFTQAYASAICSPSRVSLMTGMNASRHRVSCWTLRKNVSPEHKHPTLNSPSWNMNGMSASNIEQKALYFPSTLPNQLRKAGYRTIHAGKAHFGAKDTSGANPLTLGFDVNIAGNQNGGPGSYHGDKNFSAAWRKGDLIWNVPGLEKYHGQKINLTEAITREVISEMELSVKKKQPFYLYMSHYAVHAPWEEDRRFYQKYLNKGLKGTLAKHASMIESMDHSLGEIMTKVNKLGIEDNTIIIFMSDNGSPSQMSRNLPLRGHKITAYEGGTRVPLIVKWPGVSEANTITTKPIIIEDIYPTILEMADAKHLTKGNTDGQSFCSIIKGRDVDVSQRSFVWHYPCYYNQQPFSAIRVGDWKMIFSYNNQKYQLYNLKDDLSEKNNLSKTHPEKLKMLRKKLRIYLDERKAQYPTLKKTNKLVKP